MHQASNKASKLQLYWIVQILNALCCLATEEEPSNGIKLIKVDETEGKEQLIDLRSDTVTLPTDEMRQAACDVGHYCK